MTHRLDLKIRLFRDDDIAFGPGKADLVEAIDRTGSISAAARELGMSYRRAWLLVDVMNRCFREPLVAKAAGGAAGGGAVVTDTGRQVLTLYRTMQARADDAVRAESGRLAAMLSRQ